MIRPEGLEQLGRMTSERWALLVQQLTELKVIRKAVNPDGLFVNLE
mgnify:FL=1